MTEARVDLTAYDKSKAAFDSVTKNLDRIQTKAVAVTGVLAGLGVTAYVTKMASDVLGAVTQWDELGKAAQRAGFQSAQGLAEYQFAAKLAGVESANFETSVSKLSQKMADAAGGGKESAAVFQALGIRLKDNNGHLRATEDVLAEVAERFASFKDGPEKAALAQELFGKSGRELIPLLNGGAAGLQKLREEYRALRGEISGETIRASEQYNDNITKLEASVGSLSRSLAERMLPGLVQITDAMVDQAKKGGTLAGVWAGLREFWKIGSNSDAFGEAVRNSENVGRQLSDKGMQLDQLLGAQARGDSNVWIDRRVANLRKEIEALQSKALAASDAVKGLVNPNYSVDPSYQKLENRRLSGDGRKAAPVTSKDGGAGADEYAGLINRIRERLAAQTAEISAGKQLTDQEKFTIKVTDDLVNAKVKLTAAQKAQVTAMLADSAAAQKTLDARTKQIAADKAWYEQMQQQDDEAAAAEVESSKARERYRLAILEQTNALADSGEMLDLEGRLIGASDRERQLAIEHLRIELQLRKDLDALDRNLNFTPDQRNEERARLQSNAAIARAQAGHRVSQDAQAEYVDGLRSDTRGALQAAFADSKHFGRAFAESLANSIYSRVSTRLGDALTDALFSRTSGGAGSALMGLLGGSMQAAFSGTSLGASGFGTGLAYGNMDFGAFLHEGGIAGQEHTFTRPVDMRVFRGAPRYHGGGIAGDEVPAVLRKGEGVFTKGQMGALSEGLKGGRGVKITFVNNTSAPIDHAQERWMGPDELAVVVGERVKASLTNDIGDANSRFSKAILRHHDVRRRR